MKPLFLLCLPLPPPYSGEETLSLALKQAFKEMGPRPYIVSYFDTSNKQSNKKRGGLHFGNVYAVGKLVLKFLAALLRERPCAVYVPIAQNLLGFSKYSLFILIAVFFRCKILSSLLGSHFNFFFERASPFFKKWIRWTLNQIDILVVQGEALRKQFDGLVDAGKIRVVYPGLDMDVFLRNPPLAKDNKKKIDVLFVGCLSKAKGIFDLLEAIPLAVEKNPNIHFHLVGEILEKERNILHIQNPENNRRAFYEIVENLQIRQHITLCGVLRGEEKLALYKQSDIFVLPSYSESFPFVLLEAAASGLSIITTPVGANSEIYKPGENVLFAQVGNSKDLAAKIIQLAQDSHLRERMGKNNVALVKANHTHIHFGKRMDLILKALLGFHLDTPDQS